MFYKVVEVYVTLCTVLNGSKRFKNVQIGLKIFINVQKVFKRLLRVLCCFVGLTNIFRGFTKFC